MIAQTRARSHWHRKNMKVKFFRNLYLLVVSWMRNVIEYYTFLLRSCDSPFHWDVKDTELFITINL